MTTQVVVKSAVKYEGTHYAQGEYTLADDLALRMINDGVGSNKLNSSAGILNLLVSRNTILSDSGSVLSNQTTDNILLTVTANTISEPTQLQQESTGTITLAAGSGVTLNGATLATSALGMLITLLPTSKANTYTVKVST